MIDMLEVELIVQGFAIDALNTIGSVACQRWPCRRRIDKKLLLKAL